MFKDLINQIIFENFNTSNYFSKDLSRKGEAYIFLIKIKKLLS